MNKHEAMETLWALCAMGLAISGDLTRGGEVELAGGEVIVCDYTFTGDTFGATLVLDEMGAEYPYDGVAVVGGKSIRLKDDGRVVYGRG